MSPIEIKQQLTNWDFETTFVKMTFVLTTLVLKMLFQIMLVQTMSGQSNILTYFVWTNTIRTNVIWTNVIRTKVVRTNVIWTNVIRTKVVRTKVVRTNVIWTNAIRTKVVRTNIVLTKSRVTNRNKTTYLKEPSCLAACRTWPWGRRRATAPTRGCRGRCSGSGGWRSCPRWRSRPERCSITWKVPIRSIVLWLRDLILKNNFFREFSSTYCNRQFQNNISLKN